MSLFLEDPKLVVFIGVAALVVLASVLPKARRPVLVLLAMSAVLLLTVTGVVVERRVVTEKEEVEAVLDGIASALEANDVEGVVQHLAPGADETRRRARTAMEQVEIDDTGIHDLKITINRLTAPPSAEARFDGVVRFRYRMEELGRDFYAAKFVVELQRQGDRWLVTDHREFTREANR